VSEFENRRTFLRAAATAGVGWVAADLLHVDEALAWAAQHAPRASHGQHPKPATDGHDGITVLTKEQADALDAMTSRLLPSVDGRPGAHEAGVIYFIDKSLATFNADQKTLIVDGLADLNKRAGTSFATMTAAQQDALLHHIEETPFFQAVRFATIVGTFAVPTYGGNRDYAGWHLLGLEHQPAFQPPFGYYDADANKTSTKGGL
jgi:gluconate 2-dehydrogenase gamma chain